MHRLLRSSSGALALPGASLKASLFFPEESQAAAAAAVAWCKIQPRVAGKLEVGVVTPDPSQDSAFASTNAP